MRIIFVGTTPQARVYKQVKTLKKYYKIEPYLICYRYDSSLFDGLFEKVFILKKRDPYDEIKYILSLYKFNLIHFYSDKIALLKPIIDLKLPYLFDPYDYFLPQDGIDDILLLEQWQKMVYYSKSILLRYDISIYENNLFKKIDLKDKQVVQLFDYCLDEFFVNEKQQYIDNSIVHIGYISKLTLPKHLFSPTQFDEIARVITDYKYKYIIYSSLWSNDYSEIVKDYYDILEKSSGLFKIFKAIPQNKLNSTISKYKYGSYLHTIDDEFNKNMPYIKNSVGNKVFNYIEALLPILSSKEFEATSKIIKKYKIGEQIDINNFRIEIERANNNYEEFLNNIKIVREEDFNIKNHIYKLYDLYKEII